VDRGARDGGGGQPRTRPGALRGRRTRRDHAPGALRAEPAAALTLLARVRPAPHPRGRQRWPRHPGRRAGASAVAPLARPLTWPLARLLPGVRAGAGRRAQPCAPVRTRARARFASDTPRDPRNFWSPQAGDRTNLETAYARAKPVPGAAQKPHARVRGPRKALTAGVGDEPEPPACGIPPTRSPQHGTC
jgi:hypothetical protein